MVCGQSEQLQTNSRTLWFPVIIFQAPAITWHAGQTFVFQIVVKKLHLLLPPPWPLTGVMDGRHMGVQRPLIRRGNSAKRTAVDSILLQGAVGDRGHFISDLHRRTTGLGSRCTKLEGTCRQPPTTNEWQRAGQAFAVIMALKHDNGTLSEADHQQRSAGLGSL